MQGILEGVKFDGLLIVEDEEDMCETLYWSAKKCCGCRWTLREMAQMRWNCNIEINDYDLVVLDLNLWTLTVHES